MSLSGRPNAPNQLAVISVADGSVAELLAFDGDETSVDRAAFSGDGRYVVYDHWHETWSPVQFEPGNAARIVCILLILAGIAGLRFTGGH